ncbi:MAG: hypothetical protein EOP88_07505 [Verrucomicrobiaceae bacterium]|nr:MAG: hypothetical protein EOP88_07505 [Verrucomicrobiaceae bacterium]
MEAKRHMLDGIARMDEGDWLAALAHFEKAVDLRETKEWREDPEAAWVLAAAWINRGDVLQKLGRHTEGVHALDRGIEAMAHVSLDRNPSCAGRLVLAWIKRGTACGEAGKTIEALAGFAAAEGLLETWAADLGPDAPMMASMLHANRARLLLDLGKTVDGWKDAGTAVELLKPLQSEGVAAVAAIKAHGILCRALAMLLDEPGGTKLVEDWIASATNAAEEALALVRSSGYRREWVADLVRYGARIYRACQPHFLGEFICEWVAGKGPLAGDEALKREMLEQLQLAKAELGQRVRLYAHDDGQMARSMQILASFQFAEKLLATSA